jgi:uncharacterized protein (TIGR02001 family)
MGTNRRIYFHLAAVMIGIAAAGNAFANEDELPTANPPPAPPAAEMPFSFDVAFGVAGTTDYVSRGITNSDSNPALQGYIEPSYGPIYANVWASNVDYGAGFEGTEIDVAAGMRPKWGPVSFDLGYVHYFYSPTDTSPDYGEFYAKANYNFEDKFTLNGRVFFAPDVNQSGKTATFVAGGVTVPLPMGFKIYGGIGYQFYEDEDAFEQLAWTAGASYTWKMLTFDVRYWETDLSRTECASRSGFEDGCDARVVGTISFDTSFSGLKELTGN